MKRFEVILWDVDNTLLDFDKSEDYALRYSFEQFGKKIDTETVHLYSKINMSYWERLERGEITKDKVLSGRFESLFEELHICDIPVSEFKEIFQKALGSIVYYKDDSYKLCKELSKEFKQYVVTNGVTWTQESKMKLSGFDKIMDDIFISEQIGNPKPSPLFFDECFKMIPGFVKEKTIIIGDSLTSDMKGGNNADISCCWYNPNSKENNSDVKIDFEIKNLWEVKDILYG